MNSHGILIVEYFYLTTSVNLLIKLTSDITLQINIGCIRFFFYCLQIQSNLKQSEKQIFKTNCSG